MAYKAYEGWILASDVTKTRKEAIDANGVWLHATTNSLRSDIPSTLFFTSGTGDPSGAVVSVGLAAFEDKNPVAVQGAQKTLSGLAAGQDSIDVMFYPVGRIVVTVSSLPGGTTLKAKVSQ